MKKEQQEGIFVVSENTHHYNGAPSGILYTFMKGRGLWIKNPLDIAFFQGKVERGSGFHIEKSAINIADKVKVVKKESQEKESIKEKIKKKMPGKKKPTAKTKKKAVEKMSKDELEKAVAELEAAAKVEEAEPEVEEELPEEMAALVEEEEPEEVEE